MGTSDPKAYYLAVTMLRKAGLRFRSVLPGREGTDCALVVTTSDEAPLFGKRAQILNDLSDDPAILKGQILSRLNDGAETVLIGVDPGSRTGMAAFYGRESLAFSTFDSIEELCSKITEFVLLIPGGRPMVRVGDGNMTLAQRIVGRLKEQAPGATIEVVDESGTSKRAVKGLQGDQAAAAKIAFRKGRGVH